MMDNNQINKHLLSSFQQFEPGLIKVLSEHASLKAFSAGDLLMNTGQYMRFTMLVVEGLVKLKQGLSTKQPSWRFLQL
jgi:CRP/FNR family transcriptional regulator